MKGSSTGKPQKQIDNGLTHDDESERTGEIARGCRVSREGERSEVGSEEEWYLKQGSRGQQDAGGGKRFRARAGFDKTTVSITGDVVAAGLPSPQAVFYGRH